MEKYICIHGHFYQPPRENPWLEDVELQDSAYPYHDWNQRITEECYRQNASSRILGADRKIVDIVNNYNKISFNFGPTLLSWLQIHEPDVYEAILEADKQSIKKFSGHGCALAQVYNHMILPLANDRDRQTQVLWGIEDFQSRFGRKPEGMWLPETAANTPSLETLADNGIKFTILAPRQARKVRKIGSKKWQDVDESSIDTKIPYLCKLPSGKEIALFFYDGPIAQDVAYGGLLHSGESFANRMKEAFAENDHPQQLVHIATDGESFGHHHRHGDMALAYCLHQIEDKDLAKITIYPEFLEKFPPEYEVQIWENSSWSCVHGVERWRSNCGCAGDHSKSGQQQWREPLRNTMDWLRDTLSEIYEKRMKQFYNDPWQLRNEYINVILNRDEENVEKFIREKTGKDLDPEQKTTFLKLLEMQRNAMLMYTSCGWFFDSIGGIETVQIMMYSARAMQLCQEIDNTDLESEYKNRIESAPAHKEGFDNAKQIYEAFVQPGRIDLNRVAAHFALSMLFEDETEQSQDIYCYSVKAENFNRREGGVQVLISSEAKIQSRITFEQEAIDFVSFYLGDHNLFAALGPVNSGKDFKQICQELDKAFDKGDSNEIINIMNTSFNGRSYSLSHLFKDQQRQILDKLLTMTWDEIERSFRHIYEHNYSIMLVLRNMNMPLPKMLLAPAQFIINQDITREIQSDDMDLERLQDLGEQALRLSLKLDQRKLKFEATRKVTQMMTHLGETSNGLEILKKVERLLEVVKGFIPDLDLQPAQNVFFAICRDRWPDIKERAKSGDQTARQWSGHFENLAQHLGLVIQ